MVIGTGSPEQPKAPGASPCRDPTPCSCPAAGHTSQKPRKTTADSTPLAALGYTDSDFSPDYGDYYDNYRSTSGNHFDYNNTPFHWTSHRQSLFAQSAYEAETYAAVDAAKEAVHITRLLESMGEHSDQPIQLYGDNKPSTTNMQNFADTSRSKALDRQAHYLRHLVHSNQINYSYVAGTDNRSDALTKSLPLPAHKRARDNWCLTSSFPQRAASWGGVRD